MFIATQFEFHSEVNLEILIHQIVAVYKMGTIVTRINIGCEDKQDFTALRSGFKMFNFGMVNETSPGTNCSISF